MKAYKCNNQLCKLAGSHLYTCLEQRVEEQMAEIARLRKALAIADEMAASHSNIEKAAR